jgi:hypothetical protein
MRLRRADNVVDFPFTSTPGTFVVAVKIALPDSTSTTPARQMVVPNSTKADARTWGRTK